MSGFTIGRIFELMNEHKLDPSAEITFSMGGMCISPDQVTARVIGSHGPYSGRKPELLISISKEWIDERAKSRLQEVLCLQVDAMFKPKEDSGGNQE